MTDGMPASLKKSLESTKVSYTQLGKCGLRVSVPILGAMSFGHKDWAPWVEDEEEKVFELLKAAYDNGLNTWDTANVYSAGVSEQLIGKAIKKHNIPRHKLVILTKCFGVVGEEPAANHIRFPQIKESKDYINQGGLSRAAIFNAVEASLTRLQTDYIDLLQIHRFDATVPIEETMKALHDLVQSGKVRYIGASSMWTYQFAMLQNTAEKYGW
jgi:aryl-alcohol dehydrogenase-like predicted oxidoreductase